MEDFWCLWKLKLIKMTKFREFLEFPDVLRAPCSTASKLLYQCDGFAI